MQNPAHGDPSRQAGTDVPKGQSEVSMEMGGVDSQIVGLTGQITELENRLSEVLKDSPPEKATDGEEPTRVPLANEIRSYGQRIALLAHQVEDIISRLEL